MNANLVWLPSQPSRFARDLFLTGITSGLTVVAFIVTTRLLASALGPDQFGAYSLGRRLLASAEPAATLGVGVGLTRYLAASRGTLGPADWTWAATVLVVAATGCITALGLLVPAGWIFGTEGHGQTYLASLALLGGYSSYIVWYSYLRGTGQIEPANAWQLAVVAGSPLIAAVAIGRTGRADAILAIIAAAHALAFIPLIWSLRSVQVGRHLGVRIRELAAFSIPRIPGILAYGGLFSVGPVVAAHVSGLGAAAELVLAQSLLRVVEAATDGFSRVALPFFSMLHSQGRIDHIRSRVENLLGLVTHGGIFASLQAWAWADELVRLWVGQEYPQAGAAIRALSFAIVPFALFTVLRPVIDSIEVKAVVSRYSLIALALTVALSLILGEAGLGAPGLALAMGFGIMVLGLLSAFYVVHRLQLSLSRAIQAMPILAAIVLFLVANGLASAAPLVPGWSRGAFTALSLVLGVALFATAVGFLRPPWVQAARNELFPK